ncbi:MAG TPA: ATP F0F1 synthase subunit B [Aestuariivirga sp.]|jgi:F-type H+-transporting ATPase subunit b|nr:ATP F0F1 synthase subunit B [Aestuariivirga sp.]
MLREPETWVAVAFVLFVGLGIYLKVPAMLAKMLDERADKIGKELAEAKKLREEAQALLAEYQKKRAEAEKDAANIVAQAKIEAEVYSVETRKKLAETIERRTKQAAQKIAQAEAAAIKEVRTTATEAAIAAASKLVGEAVQGAKGAKLIDDSIAAVKSRLN